MKIQEKGNKLCRLKNIDVIRELGAGYIDHVVNTFTEVACCLWEEVDTSNDDVFVLRTGTEGEGSSVSTVVLRNAKTITTL